MRVEIKRSQAGPSRAKIGVDWGESHCCFSLTGEMTMKILVAFTANLLWASTDAFNAHPVAWISVRCPTTSAKVYISKRFLTPSRRALFCSDQRSSSA